MKRFIIVCGRRATLANDARTSRETARVTRANNAWTAHVTRTHGQAMTHVNRRRRQEHVQRENIGATRWGRRLTFVTNDNGANPTWLPAQWRECEGGAQRRHTTAHTKLQRDVEARTCDTEHADDEARGYSSRSAQRGARRPGGHVSTSGASPANGVGAPRRCGRDSRRCAGARHGEALGARCASRASTTRQRRGLCSMTRMQRNGRSSTRRGAGSSMGATIPL